VSCGPLEYIEGDACAPLVINGPWDGGPFGVADDAATDSNPPEADVETEAGDAELAQNAADAADTAAAQDAADSGNASATPDAADGGDAAAAQDADEAGD
jgi:hypothetical protein